MADLKQLAEELVNLTVKDVNELATILKKNTESSLQLLLLQLLPGLLRVVKPLQKKKKPNLM